MIAAGSQKHEQEREIFLQASEIHRAEQRASFLDQACGGDTTMRARVERMLQAQDEAGEFFKPFETGESPSTRIVTGAADPQEGPGSELGCYRLLEKIG